jgi:hypothetical protein
MLINNISFKSFSYVTVVIQNSFIVDELLQGSSDQVINEYLVLRLDQRFPGNKT